MPSRRARVLGLAFMLAPWALACGGPAAGNECSQPGECGERLRCVTVTTGRALCMAPCGEDTWLCADGAVCLESPADGRVCWFGGGVPLGNPCAATGDLSCEPGTVCGPSTLCAQACDLERPSYLEASAQFDPDSVCEATERCEALAGRMVEGVCVTVPDAGPTDGGVDAGVTSP